ncbi:MucR family transcriptional regulator [Tessaracoccus sp. MC1627]|nr:MucR family transcriptional regulator [Tessaracoccus sp. MC1627]
MDRTADGVLCHECGQRFASLGIHLARAHELRVRVYRDRHGIADEESLAVVSAGRPRRRAHPCGRCGTILTVPGKLCDDCRVTRLVELENRQAALAEPRPVKARWRRLTGEERDDLLRAAPEEVGSLIAALQRSRVTSAEIAAVLGRSQKWMRAPIPAPTGEPRTEGPQPSLCTALSTAVGETTATPPG